MALELVQLFQELVRSSSSEESQPKKQTAVKKKSAVVKEKDKEERTEKKKPMKQASDVISRIMWDPDLQSEHFCIGYLDRFVGIIEKPFAAFCWEDLASVDQSVLAIPQHRIQYFKYKDVIVWNKATQIDDVFGSRGTGKTIGDVIEEYDKQHPKENTKNESEKVKEEEKEKHYDASNRPTHFICIPISNPLIQAEAESFQKHLCNLDSRLVDSCLPPTALHLTLAMLRINNDKEMEVVKRVMNDLQLQMISMLSRDKELKFEGVHHFRNRVLHTAPQQQRALCQFSSLLVQKLGLASIATPGNYTPFSPHVTLVKLSRPMCRQYDMKSIERGVYQDLTEKTFGCQRAECMHLCPVTAPKEDDGFYPRYHTVRNCLSDLHPAIPRTMLKSSKENLDAVKSGLKSRVVEDVWAAHDRLTSLLRFSNEKRLVVLRGLPGSGKSTVAKALDVDSQAGICNADDFRYSSQGYHFDPNRLSDVHRRCFTKCVELIDSDCPLIIIDNTNGHLWEYEAYMMLGRVTGYETKVVEVSCPDQASLGRFVRRNVHRVPMDACVRMWKEWEADPRAVLVDEHRTQDDDYLREILNDSSLASSPADIVLYTAVFLDSESRSALLSCVPPCHETVYASHMTLVFHPRRDDVNLALIGKEASVQVLGSADDGRVQAVVVEPKNDQLTVANLIPHVTISTGPGAKPKQANDLLLNWTKSFHPIDKSDLVLYGTVGAMVGPAHGHSSRLVTDSKEVELILSRQTQDNDDDMWPQRSDLPVHQLFIFDFDSTLFNTPDPDEGRREYERGTGQKWPYPGFLGHVESLLPPLVTRPGPALAEYYSHCGRAGSFTVVLTARIRRVETAVRCVLNDFGLFPDRLITKHSGDSGTDYKVKEIQNLIKEFPGVQTVFIWDDSSENLAGFHRLARETSSIEFLIFDATKIPPIKTTSSIRDVLSRRGVLPDPAYRKATRSAIRFVSDAWQKVLKIDLEDPTSLALEFGSCPLGRKSDCDLCLLAPHHMNHKDCAIQLETALKERGFAFTYVAHSSRCPRLKVQCFFTESSPVELDVVFAAVPVSILKTSPSLGTVIESVKSGDKASQAALTGPVFLRQLNDLLSKRELTGDEAVCLTDMLCCYLKSRWLKGNAFHCIRTFHVLKLLVGFLQERQQSLAHETVDALFIHFLKYCDQLGKEEWARLFMEFVPEDYIPDIRSAISFGVKYFREKKLTAESVEELLVPIRNPSLAQVDLKFDSCDSVHNWKMATFVEARLGSYIRKMLTNGFLIHPSHALSNLVSFHVDDSEAIVKRVSRCLKSFWDELLGFSRNAGGIYLSVEAYLPSSQTKKVLLHHGNTKELLSLVRGFKSMPNCTHLHFPSSLGLQERKQIHEAADKLKVNHSSQGEGKERYVTLQKLK